MDHHEGRSWTGWRRHVLLVILAFGYLTLQRIQEKNSNSKTCGIGEWEECKAIFPNESRCFGIVERSPMPHSFGGALAGQAKRAETKILSARCPASNRVVPDEVVDLIIIIYM